MNRRVKCTASLSGQSRIFFSYLAKQRAAVGLGAAVDGARVATNGGRPYDGDLPTWLILPVVICLSQRLSHACLSTHGRYSETANGSLNQLWFLWSLAPLLLG